MIFEHLLDQFFFIAIIRNISPLSINSHIIFRAAFEREAAEGSDAIDPPQRPQSSANHHHTSHSNLYSLNNSRSSVSPPLSKVGRSNDNTPVPIHNNKPMPLDQLLSQTDIDFNGN